MGEKIKKTGFCQYNGCGKPVPKQNKYCGTQRITGSCSYKAAQEKSYMKKTGAIKSKNPETQMTKKEWINHKGLLASGFF